jgi:hypothetical protein
MRYYFNISRPGADEIINGSDTYEDAERTRNKAVAAGDTVSAIYEESDDFIARTVPRVVMIVATHEGDMEVYDDGTQKPV